MTEMKTPAPRLRGWTVYASYVAAFSMAVCFAGIAVQFFRGVFQSWNSSGLLIICTVVAVEAVASLWMVKNLQTVQKHMFFYRLMEWLFILLVVKVFTEIRGGPAALWENILLWRKDFLGSFVSLDYAVNLMIVAAAWLVSYFFSNDLYLLGVEEAVYLDERIKTAPVRDLILKRYLGLGMLAVLMMGTAPRLMSNGQTVITPVDFAPVIIYFVLGLALVSLSRYADLETTWHQARLQVPTQISRRWVLYSAIIISILALLAAWLPTNYANGFFEVILAILNFLVLIVLFINYIVLFIINGIYNLVMPLFSPGTQLPEPTGTPRPTPSPPSLADTNVGGNAALIKTLIYWAIFAILVIIAFRQYLSFNRSLAEELKKFRPLRWLAEFWKQLKASLSKANKSVGEFVQTSWQRLRNLGPGSTAQSEWDYINLRRLSTREKIFFYYQALLKKADEVGFPRQRTQTPYEYARSISSNLEEGKENVQELTESFIEARYSRHEIPNQEANRVREAWQAIRRVIRNIRKSRQEAAEKKK